jgi:1,2-diacylglycerol 3-alpha-glucosyltransferase
LTAPQTTISVDGITYGDGFDRSGPSPFMKIVMVTNTYLPHVGGVARSVEAFTEEYRRRGHDVMVVCPEFEGAPDDERSVMRIPALQHFNGSDFSVVLAAPPSLRAGVEKFGPDIVHSHHPFLLGASAVRLARVLDVPLVFTHHTMYERYTHYVPGDSEAMRRFAVNLSTNYANLSDAVFAPSQTVGGILHSRGVHVPIHVVPTGVQLSRFEEGSGSGMRAVLDIPSEAFVVGHVGRFAPEKNLAFLGNSVARFLAEYPQAHALFVGGGPSLPVLTEAFASRGVSGRVHFTGVLEGRFLVSAYKAMDVFAFSSVSETQGIVLVEAMAAGVPVVALSAAGVTEVVRDGENGRALSGDDEDAFVAALRWTAERPAAEKAALREAAFQTSRDFSIQAASARALGLYEDLVHQPRRSQEAAEEAWGRTMRLLRTEWDLIVNMADAAVSRPDSSKKRRSRIPAPRP